MQPYREQSGHMRPYTKPPDSPYARRSSKSQYMFTGRSVEVPKGRLHNPSEGTGWNPIQYNPVLYSIENYPPSGSYCQSNYSHTVVKRNDDSRVTTQTLHPLPTYDNMENYYYQSLNYADPMINLSLLDLDAAVGEQPASSSSAKKETETKPTVSGSGKSKSRMRESQFRLFTGSVEKVLGWYKLKSNFHLLFEVISLLVDVTNGTTAVEKNLILRDEKTGPSLLVAYYEIDRPLPPLVVGSVVKCFGRLTSRTSMQAFKVVQSTEEERAHSQRLMFISNLAAEEAKGLLAKK